MPHDYIPSVTALTLGRNLAHHRQQAALTTTQAAERLEWSRGRVGHIETGRTKPSVGDVEQMVDLYDVPSPEREVLLALAGEAPPRGWWTAYKGLFHGPYVALEDAASTIRQWSPLVMPGLLQTPEYARETIAAGAPGIDVEQALRARTERQFVLRRQPNAPHLHVVLDESVIHRAVGGSDILRDQLYYLRAEAARPNVTVQLLPMAAGTHPGMVGPFVLFEFPEHLLHPEVAYSEGFHGAVYMEQADRVGRCRVAFEQLCAKALSPEETADRLKAAAKQL